MIYNLVCIECGKLFKVKGHPQQKHCSLSCGLKGRKISDNNIFSPLTEQSVYILGLIWTDGNLYSQNKKSCLLSICNTDYEVMKQVHKLITPQKKLYEQQPVLGKSKKIYSVKTRKPDIIKILRDFGLHEKKTYTLDWPINIPIEYQHHFIRGIFDGDGCVFKNKVSGHDYLHISITGVRNKFIETLFLYLAKYNPRWYQDARTKSWQIKIYRRNSVKEFAQMIYSGATIWMKRKKKIFLDNKYLI